MYTFEGAQFFREDDQDVLFRRCWWRERAAGREQQSVNARTTARDLGERTESFRAMCWAGRRPSRVLYQRPLLTRRRGFDSRRALRGYAGVKRLHFGPKR